MQMISSINANRIAGSNTLNSQKSRVYNLQTSPITNHFNYSKEASQALKLNSLNFARTVKFTGALVGAFNDLNQVMVTCKTKDSEGEEVGKVANINKLLHDFAGDFSQEDDAIKTTLKVGDIEEKKTIINENGEEDEKIEKIPYYARAQVKMKKESQIKGSNDILFEMVVRKPTKEGITGGKCNYPPQKVGITITPINYKGQGTKEQTYVLNTKGNLMAVIEGPDDVILTNAGDVIKKDASEGTLAVHAEQRDANGELNKFKPFATEPQPVRHREPQPSQGEGTEIIIGMENDRFVDEIKASIKTFVQKVKRGQIVLDKFVEAPNAKNTQLVMLAGGFGSRAEYTNASSSAIFHGEENGSQSTKGVFRTATGLTPMETSFITLHNAGLLNCSQDTLEIGKNIKFYLNKDINRGNGGYTIGLAKKMDRPDAKSILVLPNDSMSRMTNAVIEAKKLVDSGDAAVAMIAKKVPAKDCIKTFGIMKLGNNNEILEFAEKPEIIPEGYADKDNMCLTNTFQFAVSKEALKVMDLVEPYFNPNAKSKETRDWSKQYIPVIKAMTQENNYDNIRKILSKPFGYKKKDEIAPIPDSVITRAKEILGNQKLISVPTSEPWADCGTLNQLYYTTMQIARGDFPLEDFERAHVLECVDTENGLVASNSKQLKRIKDKYNVSGQVMVVPMAKTINKNYVSDIPVTENPKQELL